MQVKFEDWMRPEQLENIFLLPPNQVQGSVPNWNFTKFWLHSLDQHLS